MAFQLRNPTAVNSKTWVNNTNIFVEDFAYTEWPGAIAPTGVTTEMDVTGFGFTIPAGSTINSVTTTLINLDDYLNLGFGDGRFYMELLGIASSVLSVDAYYEFGLPGNAAQITATPVGWGAAGLSSTIINDPGFGFRFFVENISAGNRSIAIDAAQIEVQFTPGSSLQRKFIKAGTKIIR